MTDAGGFSGGYDRISRAVERLAADRRPSARGDANSASARASTPAANGTDRASDAEREAVAERVRTAVADGRLGLDELDDRLAAAYAARTQGELDAVIADLPAAPGAEQGPLELRTKSGTRRKSGYWVVPTRIVVECTSATVTLDFTEAVCDHREVLVEVSATSGTIVLVVPAGWDVNLDRVATASGSLVNKVAGPPHPGAPLLRVNGKVRSGSVRARHRRRTFLQWLTRT